MSGAVGRSVNTASGVLSPLVHLDQPLMRRAFARLPASVIERRTL